MAEILGVGLTHSPSLIAPDELKNYSLTRSGYGKFYHLFSHHENQNLPFINSKSRSGFTFSQGKPHDIIINIQDYSGNKIEIKANISSEAIPEYEYAASFNENACSIKFNGDQTFKPLFSIAPMLKKSTATIM